MSCWNCGLPMRSTTFMCRGCGSAVRRSNSVAARDTSRPTVSGGANLDYAGIFPRLLALLVDGAILGGMSALIALKLNLLPDIDTLAAGPDDPIGMSSSLNETFTRVALAGVVVHVIYHTVLLSLFGRTAGAFLTGIKVVSLNGGRLVPLTALLRAIASNGGGAVFAAGVVADIPVLILISGLVGLLVDAGYWLALSDSRNQTLHDKIAGTLVVSAGVF